MPRNRKAREESVDEDLIDEGEQPTIEPYTVLGLEKSATEDEVKKAYRKAALKHHPDKAPEHSKATAHTKFQEIAFAYAILSSPTRRSLYDATGSTSETISDDPSFSWSDFYASQYRDVITGSSIEEFKAIYKGSEEEKDDLLAAYTKYKGKWSGIYQTVMLSDLIEDEERFRTIIDAAIAEGEVKAWKAYTGETERQKEARRRGSEREGREAVEHARKIGVYDKLFGEEKGGGGNGEDALAAMIQKRQVGRGSFLESLEAKYAGESKKVKGKKGKKRGSEDEDGDGEPSEEAFQAAAARLKSGKSEAEDGRKAKRAKR